MANFDINVFDNSVSSDEEGLQAPPRLKRQNAIAIVHQSPEGGGHNKDDKDIATPDDIISSGIISNDSIDDAANECENTGSYVGKHGKLIQLSSQKPKWVVMMFLRQI